MLLSRMPRTLFLALTLLTAAASSAQFTLHDAHTTASLRGIDNVGGGVAWASGTDGTILRTEDAGIVWQLCAKPPGGEHLDFRAIQAFDNNTAIIMSIGKGDQSRLYKTTDGCQSWKLIFTDPEKEGFFDALVAKDGRAFVVGDPVAGRFVIYSSTDGKFETWSRFGEQPSGPNIHISPYNGEGLYAASNSNVGGDPASGVNFATGGVMGASFIHEAWGGYNMEGLPTVISFESSIPLAKSASAGAFSFASKKQQVFGLVMVAVGGDYQQPNSTFGTAAWTRDFGKTWTASTTPPHGFRSAVAYDSKTNTWITVGPNGTDISTDDGRNWHALHPDPKFNDAPDADQHWNALSLPYAVGPHGRIGTLRPTALKQPSHATHHSSASR